MKYKITLLLVLLFNLFYGQVTFTTVPLDKQLVGRDLITNKGNIIIEGEVDNSGSNYNSIKVEVYRDNVQYSTADETLSFTSNIASFNFDFEIVAELVNYSVKIYGNDGNTLTLIKEIVDIVAGDVYIIQGQSNAAARKRNDSANSFINQFIRVYASGTNLSFQLSDVNNQKWFIGQGDSDNYINGNTGQWGLKLAYNIVNTYGIPVAIFNGAQGSVNIEHFQAPPDYQTSISSNYGKMYFRLNKTGLKDYVRAVLWSQGETDSRFDNATSTADYKNSFISLKNSWRTDYPNIEHFYIFQTRNGCNHLIENLMRVKEAQRQLAFDDPDISIMSTAAITPWFFDYCHFGFANGYETFTDRIFPLVRRDLYGWVTSDEIDPPMILDAYLQNDTTLIVETDANNLSISTIAEDFELSNAGSATINSISINTNKIEFTLSQNPGASAEISYVAQAQDAVGNFVTNSFGLELICFNKFPIRPISITSNTDGNWNDVATWSGSFVPSANNNVTIDHDVTIVSNGTVNNLSVESGTLTINSGGSLIVEGTSTGNITYNRNLATSNWYLISAPIEDQDIDDFVSGSGLQTGTGDNIGLGTYNTVTNSWSYYQNGTSNSDVFSIGKGYAVNLLSSSGGDISFTGTMNVDDVSIALTNSGNGFNLLGNMYTSYIDSGSVLSTNSDALLTQTLWIWDESINGSGGYETKVTADAFQLAPGQGFFVQSDGNPGSVVVNESTQSHQGTDTFTRTFSRPEVYLTLSDGTNTRETRIYYIEGTTTGFDNGYDGPMFGGVSNSFAIYTHLVGGGSEMDLAVQSLPINDYENLIVPIGINAFSGTELTISANSINLPQGIDLYLEDKNANTFTLLDIGSNFSTTINNDLNGTGRFYLHTTSGILGLNSDSIDYSLQIYTIANPRELIVNGQLIGNTKAELFDLQGRLLLSEILDRNRTKNIIDISSLNTGIFVLKVTNGIQSRTQKIVIQ